MCLRALCRSLPPLTEEQGKILNELGEYIAKEKVPEYDVITDVIHEYNWEVGYSVRGLSCDFRRMLARAVNKGVRLFHNGLITDIRDYLSPEILENLCDHPEFHFMLQETVTTRMKLYWKENLNHSERNNAGILAISFVDQIPGEVWPYLFQSFGPKIEVDEKGMWMDTEIGQAFAEYFPNPREARTRMKEYEVMRRQRNEELANLFRVPDKKRNQFLERPSEYFDLWKKKESRIRDEISRRHDNGRYRRQLSLYYRGFKAYRSIHPDSDDDWWRYSLRVY